MKKEMEKLRENMNMNRTSSWRSVLSETNLSIKNSIQKNDDKKQPITSLKQTLKSRNNSGSLSNTTQFSKNLNSFKNFNFGSTERSLGSDQQLSKVNKPQLTRKRHSKPTTTSIFLKNTQDNQQYPPITQIYITHHIPHERSPRVLFNT